MKNIIIGTSCYKNAKEGNLVSITGDGGNAWGFYGSSYKKLAPSLKLYTYYKNNPDNLSDIDLIEYYIKEYFYHRLANLNINELLYEFKEKFGDEIILLCHELPSNSNLISIKHFCHRRIFADYLYLTNSIIVPEVSINNGNKIIIKQPDYKPLLKKLMK